MTDSKPTTDPEEEEQKAAKFVANKAFDEFAISLTVMAAVIERTATLLDSKLSKENRRPGRDPNAYTAGLRAADHLARMIVDDTELSLEEKWQMQEAFHQWAGYLEQNGSLWSRYVYPNVQIANKVISSGYVGARGYSDPVWKCEAEIVLNLLRFLQKHPEYVLREQLRSLSANLSLYRPGMEASVELRVDGKGIAYVSGGVQRAA